jgi:hypothetical protein
MAKGRKTGGRRKGTPNKATAARQAEFAASGLTPLDFMLRVMRDEQADTATRLDAAVKAAPYVHPKLAAIDHSHSCAGSQLDFGQKFAGSPSAQDVEHGIFLHDLVSVFEHELHAAEVSKGCPTTFEV